MCAPEGEHVAAKRPECQSNRREYAVKEHTEHRRRHYPADRKRHHAPRDEETADRARPDEPDRADRKREYTVDNSELRSMPHGRLDDGQRAEDEQENAGKLPKRPITR